MKKRLLSVTALAALLIVAYTSARNAAGNKEEQKRRQMEEILKNLPDSVFEDVKIEDLLDDEVYLKLAKDGWSSREITTIMETAVKDKKKARNRGSYGAYAKQWRPAFGRAMSDDPLYQVKDSSLSPQAVASIYEAVGEVNYDATWPVIPYNPKARKTDPNYRPDGGYFKPVELKPSSGRTHWIVVDQENEKGDNIYAITDAGGIFSTRNGGKSWTCITDNIPHRANRSKAVGYSIPVDPDDWDHLFAFMDNSSLYETKDGGKTWERVANGTKLATSKEFKRGYCFRDTKGTLKLIGADMAGNRMDNRLWISDDKGLNWRQCTPTDDQKETVGDKKGFWFQQMAFDPKNRDIVYFPGSYSILRFTDGGRSGQFEKMEFEVYDPEGKILRSKNRFPFNGNGPGYLEIDPNNSDRMWYAVGNTNGNRTALYYSKDHGKTWITKHERATTQDFRIDYETYTDSIGTGTVFGNEIANVWLGGFGIRYTNSADKEPTVLFGCSMSSSYSLDGGTNWKEYAWGTRQASLIKNRLYANLVDEPSEDVPEDYNEPYPENLPGLAGGEGYYHVSASRHNADNHCIASHKSGRVYRGGDGGFFVNYDGVQEIERYNNNASSKTNLSEYDWLNISSNLGQMLFYDVRVNEFGDQAIIGNTQDIDVQTWRYGRWGHWRGYEGTEASFNPYTSTGYFSGGGGAGPDGMNADSWHTARNYADVVTGDWYMLRTWNGGKSASTLYRVEDIGRSLTDLYGSIGKTVTDVGLCRDKGRLTVFIRCNDNSFMMSTDTCKTFHGFVASNNNEVKFSGSKLAVDPNNSDGFYFGQNGGIVNYYDIKNRTWSQVGTGLPTGAKCSRLIFHEGSGDLYYVDYSSGIYILEHNSSTWRFWTRGYNNSKFTDCDINYTTQEMVIADYGRGVWVADLQNPADRYFSNNFKLKEISHRDGRRVFGIDTEWTIPMYYNYKWKINGKDVDNPYQYLNIDENDYQGQFSVQLELSLREAPYVKTVSEVLNVTPSAKVAMERRQGNALYSNGDGRVDIGYMDWFFKDFSVDFWIKPQGDGVILANMAKNVDRGAKGWTLYIEGGVLKFKYYPFNWISQPTFEVGIAQNDVVTGSAIPMNKWSHVAATFSKANNHVYLYINGEQVGDKTLLRPDENYTLNNSVIMSLFGDAFESSTLKASVDELKFWKKALSQGEVRREMFSTDLSNPGDMVAHYDFNGETLEQNTETFTGYKPKSRTRAVTSPERMTVPVSANYVATGTLSQNNIFTADNNSSMPILELNNTVKADNVYTVVYGYDSERWNNSDDNLSEEYYTPTAYGYMIRTFGALEDASADICFHNGSGRFDAVKRYRLYAADNSDDRMYWKQVGGELKHDDKGNLILEKMKLADITDRKLLVVSMNPAIEMEIDNLSSDGRIILYDDEEEKLKFDFTASLIEGMTLPTNKYEIMSDSTIVEIDNPVLEFDDTKKANGYFEVNPELIGPFNNTISTFIRGKENNAMIPVPVDILNRISPRTLENSVQIAGGGMKVGTAADFAAITGSKNLTIMGWVRIDDANMMDKGRNNDGVSPLLFFRTSPSNTGTTGLHLRRHTNASGVFDGAMLGYHWNDQEWNYGTATPFVISKDELGKWNHIALVVKPEGAWVYFNGMEYKMPRTQNPMPDCTVQSPLLVGMNVQGGNTYFKGAFDHVAVWSRSLEQEEIQNYMQNRVLLNDDGLLAYLTMDEKDENGRIKESLKGMSSVYYGTVSTGPETPVPFAPYRQDMLMTDAKCPIKLSTNPKGCVATFEGHPYDYIADNDPAQESLPLNNEYYTLVYNALQTTTGNVTLTYANESLEDGDEIALGIRKVGSVTPFTELIKSTSIQDNKATFTVPANRLSESSEIMFFTTPNTKARPTIVHVAVDKSDIQPDDIYLVTDNDNVLKLDVNVVSAAQGAEVGIYSPQEYVTLNKKDVDLTDTDQTLTLTVELDKLRKSPESKFGLSDVKVVLNGTQAEEALTFKVGLKPKVELKLLNGTDDNHFVATSSVSTLDIETRLVEGYLTGNIDLKVTPETLTSAFNISNGSLLLNSPVTIQGLTTEGNPNKIMASGWNLVGNPYLANINLTKHQNYGDIKDKVTHFVYQRLDGSENIVAYDMTVYDASQQINPFEPFYVQTLDADVDFTVTNVAKERSLDRKTFDYLNADENRYVTLSLCDESGKEIDRTTLRWDINAKQTYVTDEDAPKVQAANTTHNAFYTFTENGVRASINSIPDGASKIIIPVGLDVVNPGTMKIKVLAMNGFGADPQGDQPKVLLADFGNGYGAGNEVHTYLAPDTDYEFTMNDEGSNDGRFVIMPVFNGDIVTSVGDIIEETDATTLYNVFGGKRTLTVDGMRGDAEIAVYNTAGVQLIYVHTSDSTYSTNLDAGVYIVRIVENNNVYATKVVVK